MVRYPSGHKGADLKSVVSVNIRRVGSNPTRTAIWRVGVMVSHRPAKAAVGLTGIRVRVAYSPPLWVGMTSGDVGGL